MTLVLNGRCVESICHALGGGGLLDLHLCKTRMSFSITGVDEMRLRIQQVSMSAIMLCAAVGCSDSGILAADDRRDQPERVRATSYQQSPGVFVLHDNGTGQDFRLDLPAGVLTASGTPNERILLSNEQLPLFATYFQERIEADSMVLDLELAASEWSPPDPDCGPVLADEIPDCEQPMRGAAGATSALPWVQYGGIPTMKLDASGFKYMKPQASLSTATLSSFTGYDPCADVLNAIVPSKLTYNESRALV
ncbi:hypothetical protein [Gemmatimonas sp.]|uniref:hypothetical protein n=1 Tax=Gemmatimonas sp. TaxID=1962908 RepID=UPI003983A0F4